MRSDAQAYYTHVSLLVVLPCLTVAARLRFTATAAPTRLLASVAQVKVHQPWSADARVTVACSRAQDGR